MTAQSPALKAAEPLLRWSAIASIVRKDMHTLGLFAAVGALGVLILSAFLHNEADLLAISSNFGDFGPLVRQILFVTFWGGLPIAMTFLVILLAQADVASDTRHDWLMRPIAPLEMVTAKVLILLAVVIAPMILGNFIYMAVAGSSLGEAFAPFLLVSTCCCITLIMSWLVSTPFRAVVALAGMFVLSAAAIVLAELIKRGIGLAFGAPGDPPDPTPFPDLANNWARTLVEGISVYTIFAVTLWLLLARRKRTSALWLFCGGFAASMFLQSLLFTPI